MPKPQDRAVGRQLTDEEVTLGSICEAVQITTPLGDGVFEWLRRHAVHITFGDDVEIVPKGENPTVTAQLGDFVLHQGDGQLVVLRLAPMGGRTALLLEPKP